MQPYLFPYIGYFQLLKAVDQFIILDNVQYINRGWINRNRVLINGKDNLFSFSVKKDGREKNICERFFAEDFKENKGKFLQKLQCAYKKAPNYEDAMDVIEKCLQGNTLQINRRIGETLIKICQYLNINTEILYASELLSKEEKGEIYLIQVSKKLNADIYINPIGGQKLYNKENFKEQGIDLYFLQTEKIEYEQFKNEFVENLSIIDVMMFNSAEKIGDLLERYTLI